MDLAQGSSLASRRVQPRIGKALLVCQVHEKCSPPPHCRNQPQSSSVPICPSCQVYLWPFAQLQGEGAKRTGLPGTTTHPRRAGKRAWVWLQWCHLPPFIHVGTPPLPPAPAQHQSCQGNVPSPAAKEGKVCCGAQVGSLTQHRGQVRLQGQITGL